MRAMVRAVIAAALALAGCARLPIGHHAPPRGGETITYSIRSPGLCLIGCDFDVTLGPDGQGIYTGVRSVAVIGDRRFRATPEQAAAFRSILAPLRPNGRRSVLGGGTGCPIPVTEGATVDVDWRSADGAPHHLSFYTGCDRSPYRTETALVSAPYRLPIAELTGRPDPTRPTPPR